MRMSEINLEKQAFVYKLGFIIFSRFDASCFHVVSDTSMASAVDSKCQHSVQITHSLSTFSVL